MISSILYFSIAIVATSISVMNFSMNGMYISRTVLEMPNQVVEGSIEHFDDKGNNVLYFNKLKLRDNVKNYFNASLKGHIKEYKIGFAYYEIVNGNKEQIISDTPQNVSIRFMCTYNVGMKYENYLDYELERLKLWMKN